MSRVEPIAGEAFLLMVRQLPVPALLIDGSGIIVTCSAIFEESVNCPPGELPERSLFLCCQGFSVSEWQTCLRRGGSFLLPWAIGVPRSLVGNVIVLDPDGLALITLTVPDASRFGSASAAGRHSSLEVMGTLVGSVAHDLNNILTSILGHVSFLRLSSLEFPVDRSSLDAVEEGTRRAATISQRILDVTRGVQAEQRAVVLGSVIEATLNLIRSSIPPNVELFYRPSPDSLVVFGDESQLTQIVLNVALNARDALVNGGSITVTLQPLVLVETTVVRGVTLPPGIYAECNIHDDGEGISPEIQSRIFEPFFTTKAARGTGLGLAIVSSFAEGLGGAIDVSSGLGIGTVFRLLLPAQFAGESPRAARPALETAIFGGEESILVVDDEDAVRTIVQKSLEHLGYRVLTAQDGLEALELYRTRSGEFDLVIIDMIMPHMAGDELFRNLQELDADVPVLVASGYSSDARTRSILEHGGLGFIQKPFAVEELAREVRRCLDRARERSNSVIS